MKNIGNVFILGDSYSTFFGHIPEGFDAWYSAAETPNTNVRRVEETWWHQLLSETESTLIRNCSYSGTTECHTGYEGSDCKEISFTGRFEKLVQRGFFKENKIDTFFLFGGTNDAWSDAPLGEIMYEGQTMDDLYKVLPAFGYLAKRIKEEVDARIICVINCDIKDEIMEGYAEMCRHLGIEYVQLADVSKWAGHPNIDGMVQIKDQVLAIL